MIRDFKSVYGHEPGVLPSRRLWRASLQHWFPGVTPDLLADGYSVQQLIEMHQFIEVNTQQR